MLSSFTILVWFKEGLGIYQIYANARSLRRQTMNAFDVTFAFKLLYGFFLTGRKKRFVWNCVQIFKGDVCCTKNQIPFPLNADCEISYGEATCSRAVKERIVEAFGLLFSGPHKFRPGLFYILYMFVIHIFGCNLKDTV